MSIRDEQTGPGTNTGHGHVWPRPDRTVMRCGGPRLCKKCAADAQTWQKRTTWTHATTGEVRPTDRQDTA